MHLKLSKHICGFRLITICIPIQELRSLNNRDQSVINSDIRDTVSNLEHVTFGPVDYSIATQAIFNTAMENSMRHNPIVIPSNNNAPVSVYEMPCGEEKAFPWLFPQGKYGFTYPRPVNIRPSLYFRYRLYNHHGFWISRISHSYCMLLFPMISCF